MELEVIRRRLKYNTRRMMPGDRFEADDRDARLFIAIKRAIPARPLAGTSVPAPMPSEDITALRAEYLAKLGKRPFNGWDAATLREKIAAA